MNENTLRKAWEAGFSIAAKNSFVARFLNEWNMLSSVLWLVPKIIPVRWHIDVTRSSTNRRCIIRAKGEKRRGCASKRGRITTAQFLRCRYVTRRFIEAQRHGTYVDNRVLDPTKPSSLRKLRKYGRKFETRVCLRAKVFRICRLWALLQDSCAGYVNTFRGEYFLSFKKIHAL